MEGNNQKHILVVDDEESIRMLLQEGLEMEGFSVTTAETGEEALKKVMDSPPDAITLDVMLPGMDGFEVCKSIKSRREYNMIPIIMITAKDTEGDKITGLKMGADEYVTKPFNLSDIIDAINTAINKKKEMIAQNIEGKFSLAMQSQYNYIKEVNDMVSRLYRLTDFTPEEIANIEYAINEIGTNAIEHGNKEDVDKLVKIDYTLYKDKLVIEIEDEGEGFDFNSIPDPSKKVQQLIRGENVQLEDPNRKRPGGWGIYLARAMLDKVEFNEKGNKVTMTKYIRKNKEMTDDGLITRIEIDEDE